MTSIDPQPAVPPSEPPRFQFSLWTLLLLFVVLGSSLAVFGGSGIAVFVIVVALALGIRQARSLSSPLIVVWALFCLIGFLVVLLLPLVNVAREASRRAACHVRMRDLALGLKNYRATYGHFPPAYIADKNGKPIHSWRVLMLPFMECNPLYEAYDLTEPWDGPKNKTISEVLMLEFICPSEMHPIMASHTTQTSYFAVVGANAGWAGAEPRTLTDFGPDASHTIMLIEVANSSIAWTEPRDFSIDTLNVSDSKSPPMALASHRMGHSEFFFIYDGGPGVHVAMADGSVHFLRTDYLSPDDLRKVLAIGGCKNVAGGPHVALDDDEWRLNWPSIAALTVWMISVGMLLTQAVRSRNPPVAAPRIYSK